VTINSDLLIEAPANLSAACPAFVATGEWAGLPKVTCIINFPVNNRLPRKQPDGCLQVETTPKPVINDRQRIKNRSAVYGFLLPRLFMPDFQSIP
jgi:hypothetical protein